MNIFYAFLTLGVLGGVFGLVLAVASKVFEVKTDPKLDLILDCLPGANCGCGYPGCAGCAAAILAKKAPVNACPSCSGLQTSRIAAVMGVEVKAQERRVAFVRCNGGSRASRKFERYVGIADCVAAMKVSGNGTLDCAYSPGGSEQMHSLHAVRQSLPPQRNYGRSLRLGHHGPLRQPG